MIADRVSLELKNSLSELSTLGSSLEEFGEALGLSSKILFEISLSIEELFSNIVSYGYTDDAVHWIKLTISHEDEMLVIRLEDDGIPFNPLRAEEPDCECPIEERKIGNLGIHLTKKFMDDMIYKRKGNRNILIVKKKITVT